mmetsp:Transcript_5140/g.15687  ORF Transcript_5140/g.15687 Transcript_5140/m.15687 type:complete len:901 (+) Transcript_5140:62-2764(+)
MRTAALLGLFSLAVGIRLFLLLLWNSPGRRSRQASLREVEPRNGAAGGLWSPPHNAAHEGRAETLSGATHKLSERAQVLRALRELESEHAPPSNTTSPRIIVVLGHKAPRDFYVYSFAFHLLGYRVIYSRTPILVGAQPHSGLYYLSPDNGGRPIQLHGVAAVLCHSVLAQRCFAGFPWSSSLHGEARVQQHPLEVLRIFSALQPNQRINRLASARQTLTTKDGLCAMLHAAGLAGDYLSTFTFPCWSIPHEASQLRAAALEVGGRIRADLPHATSSIAAQSSSAPSRPTWIVKPARGSEGAGIRLLSQTELLSLLDECELDNNEMEMGVREANGTDKNKNRGDGATRAHGQRCGNRGLPQPSPGWRGIVNPYLATPLLHNGRKWDVRAYVLCTSVLPMRIYIFAEAVVRYASALYSSTTSDPAAVLTNTAIGKRALHRGVAPITGTLDNLARYLQKGRAAESSPATGERGSWLFQLWDAAEVNEDEGDGSEGSTDGFGLHRSYSAMEGYTSLIGAMRQTVGRLFLTAEPQIMRSYAREYPHTSEASKPWRQSVPSRERGVPWVWSQGVNVGAEVGYRCSNCYHLFGVDLIADNTGQFRAIEINVQPDLSLSLAACERQRRTPKQGLPRTGGPDRLIGNGDGARYAPEGGSKSPSSSLPTGMTSEQKDPALEDSHDACSEGSSAYDDTKRAVAFSVVQMVYGDHPAAAILEELLAPHGDTLAIRFPKLAHRRMDTKADAALGSASDVASIVDSRDSDVPNGPYGLHRETLVYLLGSVREALALGCFVPVVPSISGWHDQARHLRRLWNSATVQSRCAAPHSAIDSETRCAGFDFEWRRQIHDLSRLVFFGNMESGVGNVPQWRLSFKERCEEMLAQVANVPNGQWALRQDIFQTVYDLED